ncbi:hypothetical protein MNV49_007633 [Pseudohyphozyma bogoriensis]|nr:hypothetical protein MNV49_007633 [Pseudohyphozyma bogoriensis]
MGFFSDDSFEAQAAQQVRSGEHKSSWTHELIAGAAAFEAAKAYEKHEEANGKVENHQFAKELFAGFVGAETDKLVETHGLDFIDREKAKHQAKQHGFNAVPEW